MILTLDIGGANTKLLLFNEAREEVVKNEVHYFPFWRRKGELRGFLRSIAPPAESVAVTLTAELSDVFESKQEGVDYVTSMVKELFPEARFLSVEKRLVEEPESFAELAGANYVASVYYLERFSGEGVLLDIGSTTCDVVPFRRGEVLYRKTDLERLFAGQLVYTGYLRTPLSTIAEKIPFRGYLIRPASEYFAITADLYLILGELTEYSCDTPDGGEKNREAALRRVARLLCADLSEVGEAELLELCRYLAERQAGNIAEALRRVGEGYGLSIAYLAGIGRALGRRAAMAANLAWRDLAEVTPAYDNLPCLGLAYMVLDDARG
ncbi:hydantoinase/oxoprolinase family protein [Candidatus Pyrohabitans sp.]